MKTATNIITASRDCLLFYCRRNSSGRNAIPCLLYTSSVSVLDANAATMDETLTWFCKDGVLYELIECDDLEIFADRGVQLGIVDSFGSETAAFRMDNESGSYRKVEDYAGTIALFTLPLDTTKADPAAAEEYLKKLEEAAAGAEAADTEGTAGRAEVSVITGAESKAAAGYMNQQVRDFVDGITADNLSDYFEIVKDYPISVSYTHLDVYKRQVYGYILCCTGFIRSFCI